MKKTYITPAMVIAMTATTNVFAGSPTDTHDEIGTGEYSKGSSMWEYMESDEEEEK